MPAFGLIVAMLAVIVWLGLRDSFEDIGESVSDTMKEIFGKEENEDE